LTLLTEAETREKQILFPVDSNIHETGSVMFSKSVFAVCSVAGAVMTHSAAPYYGSGRQMGRLLSSSGGSI